MELRTVLSAGRSAALRRLSSTSLHERLDPAWLRSRLAAPDPQALDPSYAAADDPDFLHDEALAEAAVLVGLTAGEAPGVLLTKRAGSLRKHSGQVSFPGGRIDPGDASAEAAALREAQEEIGLDPALVTIAGRMTDYVTITGYRVTPVVAVIAPGFTTVLSPFEVEAVFELPLATLLDPAAPKRHTADFRGQVRHYWVWPHAEFHIWGATAAILMQLARRLG